MNFALTRERPAAPPPVVAGGMAEFENAQSWRKEGASWIHAGGGFVVYKLPPKGVFTFTVELLKGGGVFRPGQIRWCLQYLDARNYLLYEMDRKNFWAGVIEKGKRYERSQIRAQSWECKSVHHSDRCDARPPGAKGARGQRVEGARYFCRAGPRFTHGKFGFLIPGNDEIAISDFNFCLNDKVRRLVPVVTFRVARLSCVRLCYLFTAR